MTFITQALDAIKSTIGELVKPEYVTPRNDTQNGKIAAPHLIIRHKDQALTDISDKVIEAATRLKPLRRTGTATLTTLDSLIDWTIRNKNSNTVIYADINSDAPKLTSIANYHGAGPAQTDGQTPDPMAQYGDHRAVYNFPFSNEWKRWSAISGKPLEKDEMAAFIDDNAKDFIDPTPALLAKDNTGHIEPWEKRLIEQAAKIDGRFGQHLKLIEMSRAFQVYETSNITVSANRDSGENNITFVNEHKDATGKPLQIPNLFLIAIPVFQSGALYRLPVRFQYRKNGGSVRFMLTIYDPQRAFEDATDEAVEKAKTATDVQIFLGIPEKQ